MKIPITVRVDPELLHAARDVASRENRSLTNLIETALRDRVGELVKSLPSQAALHNSNQIGTRNQND